MITSAVALVVLGGLQSPPSSLLTPQIKQEVARVIALSNNGKLPGFWPSMTEEDWHPRRMEGTILTLLVGGWIRVDYDLVHNRVRAFSNPLPAVPRGTPPESREVMLARAAKFDRDMGLPPYNFIEEWLPSHKNPLPDGTERPRILRLTRSWPGNPIPYGSGSQSGMTIDPESHNIRMWGNGIYSLPPIGPPPAFLPSEALQIQAVATCLDLRPDHLAQAFTVEITLNAVRRRELSPLMAARPGTTYWARPLTPTQLYAQQQGLSVYEALIRIGLTDAAGNSNTRGTVILDPVTGQVDEVFIRRTARRGAETPVPIAAPSPGEAAWLARDGVRSRVVLTAPPAQKRPEGLPSGVLMAKDTARRVEIDARAKVLWFQSATGWRSLGWEVAGTRPDYKGANICLPLPWRS